MCMRNHSEISSARGQTGKQRWQTSRGAVLSSAPWRDSIRCTSQTPGCSEELGQPQPQVTAVSGDALVRSTDTAGSRPPRLPMISELCKTKALQPLSIPPLQQGSGKRPEEWNTGNSLKQGFSQKFHIPKCPESRGHNKCLQ